MKNTLCGMGIILLLSTLVSADITLGSIADVNYLTLNPGEIGEFKASFFSLGDDAINIKLTAEYPDDLRVEMHPEEFTIDSEITGSPNSGGEWFVLRDGKTYARTYPVRIYVRIPSQISRNLYRIKIIATAKNTEELSKKGIRQSLAQVREITLTAYVPGEVASEVKGLSIGMSKDSNEQESIWKEKEGTPAKEESESVKGEGSKKSIVRSEEISDENAKFSVVGRDEKEGEGRDAFGVTRDETGKTEIKTPVGYVTLTKEQGETAVDLGIVALLVSIASLVIRILK